MSWALSMMARAMPGRARSPLTPLTLTPLTPLASSAPCGACEEDKMPPWLTGHAISPPPDECRRGGGRPPVADIPLAGRYDRE